MATSQREKDAEKALRHLTKTFYKMMSVDIRIDLYGKDILTWTENEKIGIHLALVKRVICYFSADQRPPIHSH